MTATGRTVLALALLLLGGAGAIWSCVELFADGVRADEGGSAGSLSPFFVSLAIASIIAAGAGLVLAAYTIAERFRRRSP